MIQDMMNPVFYFDQYEVMDQTTQNKHMQSGRFKESLNCQVKKKLHLFMIVLILHVPI